MFVIKSGKAINFLGLMLNRIMCSFLQFEEYIKILLVVVKIIYEVNYQPHITCDIMCYMFWVKENIVYFFTQNFYYLQITTIY